MARSRRSASNETTTTTTQGENKKMAKALSLEQVQAYQAKSKARGLYDEELATFLASGEPGWTVDLTEGTFADKQPNSVKTSFDTARKRLKGENGAPGPDDIQVITDAENKQVILINKVVVREANAA